MKKKANEQEKGATPAKAGRKSTTPSGSRDNKEQAPKKAGYNKGDKFADRKAGRPARAPKGDGDFKERKPRRDWEGDDRRERPDRSEYKGRTAGELKPRRDWDSDDRRERPDRSEYKSRPAGDRKPRRDWDSDERRERPDRSGYKKRPFTDRGERTERKPFELKPGRYVEEIPAEKDMTLNKYIAHSGKCSRREAAAMVKEGKVKVNGEVVQEPGYRVQQGDKVTMNDKKLTPQRDLVYVLLNKPKNCITTTNDPKSRNTVMDLIKGVKAERVYPVGRLDRNTTGLLLMTNDGDLAQKLSHPSYKIKKVYQVTLDKDLTKAHYEEIVAGLTLEDGAVTVDALAYLDKKNEIGIEIHSGRNRIVRRIFEHLGYVVDKLDRVMYAGLTKKNIPRGKWRELTEKEIVRLKYFKS